MDTNHLLNSTLIFTDGASSGNPGPGGWGTIIVTATGQVTELGGREVPTTNNRMELTAAIRGIGAVSKDREPIHVFTDSTYLIRGITQWIWGWKKRGWISSDGKEVANVDLWKKLDQVAFQQKIKWHYIRGHSGTPGNERADQIAVEFSKGGYPNLYRGPLLKYEIAVHDLPENTDLPEMKAKPDTPAPAYSYLSLVGNTLMRHSSWAECEKRIKGQSGAKFKKAKSAEEELEIILAWGCRPSDIRN
jgi:ribonuclease HI